MGNGGEKVPIQRRLRQDGQVKTRIFPPQIVKCYFHTQTEEEKVTRFAPDLSASEIGCSGGGGAS